MGSCQDDCCVILLGLLGRIYQLYQESIACVSNPCEYPCFEDVLKPVKACVIDLLHCGNIFCCEGVAEAIICTVKTFLQLDKRDLCSYQLTIYSICQTAKATGKFMHCDSKPISNPCPPPGPKHYKDPKKCKKENKKEKRDKTRNRGKS